MFKTNKEIIKENKRSLLLQIEKAKEIIKKQQKIIEEATAIVEDSDHLLNFIIGEKNL